MPFWKKTDKGGKKKKLPVKNWRLKWGIAKRINPALCPLHVR